MKTRLTSSFFNRNSLIVAKELLGDFFVTDFHGEKVVGKIVETEAYSGEDDLACHASKGRTSRTETLYGQAGQLYIYLNYGIFYLTNIVCDKINFPSAVLIRAAEIVDGEEIVRKRLSEHKFVANNDQMATGPGKFSVAFGLTKYHNKIDITKSNQIYILANSDQSFDIIEASRIGVGYAKHCVDYPWRFYIKNNKYISKT